MNKVFFRNKRLQILVVVLVFTGLSGCSSGDNTNESNNTAANPTAVQEKKVPVEPSTLTNKIVANKPENLALQIAEYFGNISTIKNNSALSKLPWIDEVARASKYQSIAESFWAKEVDRTEKFLPIAWSKFNSNESAHSIISNYTDVSPLIDEYLKEKSVFKQKKMMEKIQEKISSYKDTLSKFKGEKAIVKLKLKSTSKFNMETMTKQIVIDGLSCSLDMKNPPYIYKRFSNVNRSAASVIKEYTRYAERPLSQGSLKYLKLLRKLDKNKQPVKYSAHFHSMIAYGSNALASKLSPYKSRFCAVEFDFSNNSELAEKFENLVENKPVFIGATIELSGDSYEGKLQASINEIFVGEYNDTDDSITYLTGIKANKKDMSNEYFRENLLLSTDDAIKNKPRRGPRLISKEDQEKRAKEAKVKFNNLLSDFFDKSHSEMYQFGSSQRHFSMYDKSRGVVTVVTRAGTKSGKEHNGIFEYTAYKHSGFWFLKLKTILVGGVSGISDLILLSDLNFSDNVDLLTAGHGSFSWGISKPFDPKPWGKWISK